MPILFIGLMDANVAVKRIGKILKGEELDFSDVTKVEESEVVENTVEVENGVFSWDKSQQPVLTDINLKVKKGNRSMSD